MGGATGRLARDPQTVREARSEYFARNGLEDGGYDSWWVRLQAGPIPIFFPNTAARVAAVRLHDIHHVATGFETTWTGEAEIAAWEIGGGCAHHVAAWILNLQAVAIGLFLSPRRVLRAFARGRRSANLYRDGFDESELDAPLDDLRQRLGVERDPGRIAPGDGLRFAGWGALGLVTLSATVLATGAPLAWLVARITDLLRG